MEWGVFTGEGESNHRSTWMKSEWSKAMGRYAGDKKDKRKRQNNKWNTGRDGKWDSDHHETETETCTNNSIRQHTHTITNITRSNRHHNTLVWANTLTQSWTSQGVTDTTTKCQLILTPGPVERILYLGSLALLHLEFKSILAGTFHGSCVSECFTS